MSFTYSALPSQLLPFGRAPMHQNLEYEKPRIGAHPVHVGYFGMTANAPRRIAVSATHKMLTAANQPRIAASPAPLSAHPTPQSAAANPSLLHRAKTPINHQALSELLVGYDQAQTKYLVEDFVKVFL